MNVKWAQADTDRNTAKGNDVFLSPTVADKTLTKRKDWTDDERTDVLIGEALVQSTMKHTIDPSVEDSMCKNSNTERGRLENEIWTVSEHIFAENKVLENYPGFKGYFASNREYYTGKDSKKHFEKHLTKGVDATSAVAGLMWELLHPSDELKAPLEMKDFLEWSKDRFAQESTSKGRADASKEIVEEAYKIWKQKDNGNNPRTEQDSLTGKILPDVGISETARQEKIDTETVNPVTYDGKKESGVNPYVPPPSLDALDWHGGTIDYTVKGSAHSKKIYDDSLKRLKSSIRDVRNRLKLRSEEQKHVEHALLRGRLDEGSIYKLGFNKFDFRDDKIFEQEEIISMPKVAFGLLVDESGSMSRYDSDTGEAKICSARDIAIIFANAMKDVEGLSFGVWGHTAEGGYHGGSVYGEEMVIHQYYTPQNPDIETLGAVKAFSNNLDGYAIGHVAKHMLKLFPSVGSRVLIHISDGLPSANAYGGSRACAHVGAVGKLCKHNGVRVVGIGVSGAFSEHDGNTMYGPGNFAIIKSLGNLNNVITNLVARTANTRS